MKESLVEVRALKKYFPLRSGLFSSIKGYVKAVDGIEFSIKRGETLALIGESGCGKTTAALCLMRLLEPDAGEIVFNSSSILHLSAAELKAIRRQMQIVFQDPFSCFNPTMRVADLIAEPLQIYNLAKGKEKRRRIGELMSLVGIEPAYMNRYPHEFSGGQRQRIGLARALAAEPQLIVADEPVSALDISLRAQILNLLLELQQKLSLTYLLIAHDLSMVRLISHQVAVMYLGRIVEMGEAQKVFHSPLHPYTRGLISSLPAIKPEKMKKSQPLPGEPPSPINPPSGCHFHPRCSSSQPICSEAEPIMKEARSGHWVACHLA